MSPDGCRATVPVPALHSILDNLLRNALSHCPPGSRAEPQLTRQDGKFRIQVSDDGPGMPAEEVEHALERFFRGQGAGPGLGSGLAIVKEATRLLGGVLSPASRHGEPGLRVTVEWPEA